MTKRSLAAFTLVEMLVVIAIIATIAAFALPAITGALTKAQLTASVSNAKQIYLATFQMATDGVQTGDAKYGWPGDLAASQDPNVVVTSVSDFVTRLVDNDYLKAGDLKVFAAPGVTPWNGSYIKPPDANSKGAFAPLFDGNTNCAFKIYKVTEKDPSNALFLATKNFSYTSNASTAINANTTPYGDKGFVIFHKGGDGVVYKRQQATSKQLIGTPPGASDTQGTPPDETNDSYLTQK